MVSDSRQLIDAYHISSFQTLPTSQW
jgi:hypothetical protein